MPLFIHFPFDFLAREPNWRTMGTTQGLHGARITIHLAEGHDKVVEDGFRILSSLGLFALVAL